MNSVAERGSALPRRQAEKWRMWSIISRTFQEFIDDECPRLAAALAYYTFFSLPALLVAIVYVGGSIVHDNTAVQERLIGHFEETIGREGAEQITAIIKNASKPTQSTIGWLIGTGMLMLGATGALTELQTALNRAWHVEPDPKQGGVWQFLTKRLLSLAMLLGIAVLVTASLAISWGLSAFGHWLDSHPGAGLSSAVLGWLHTAVSLGVITVLFAVLLKYLPDAEIDWSDVWLGAVVTSVLFWLGQSVLGMYFGWSKPTSAYGAAGSLALVLLWMYYSAMIFFLGAEFTQVLAASRGKYNPPRRGARRAKCDGDQQPMSRAA
ncbi:MAG TPA: YihY/virulence factor BrkB family protein [Pirellulaceae bacterium]